MENPSLNPLEESGKFSPFHISLGSIFRIFSSFYSPFRINSSTPFIYASENTHEASPSTRWIHVVKRKRVREYSVFASSWLLCCCSSNSLCVSITTMAGILEMIRLWLCSYTEFFLFSSTPYDVLALKQWRWYSILRNLIMLAHFASYNGVERNIPKISFFACFLFFYCSVKIVKKYLESRDFASLTPLALAGFTLMTNLGAHRGEEESDVERRTNECWRSLRGDEDC